jgi:RsiW-degrading membrane proteinase PrsW (M82 family)
MMIGALVLYFLFWIGWRLWENTNLLPGLMLIGSFAIPISALVLFIEFNVRRNVSLYMVVRLVLLGGVFSLLITHLLPLVPWLLSLLFTDYSQILGNSLAGPLEESAKVLAMVAVASAAKYRYKLNGLLVGAAVGMGFAAFESAGYAFNVLLGGGNVEDMVFNINMRGLLSPFCHIVWSAISGCALWRVINGREFKWRMLCDENFIRLFLVPVILHMIWNSPLQLPYFGTFILLGVAAWFVCFSLVQEGLHEVAAEQAEARRTLESNAAATAEGGAQ